MNPKNYKVFLAEIIFGLRYSRLLEIGYYYVCKNFFLFFFFCFARLNTAAEGVAVKSKVRRYAFSCRENLDAKEQTNSS